MTSTTSVRSASCRACSPSCGTADTPDCSSSSTRWNPPAGPQRRTGEVPQGAPPAPRRDRAPAACPDSSSSSPAPRPSTAGSRASSAWPATSPPTRGSTRRGLCSRGCPDRPDLAGRTGESSVRPCRPGSPKRRSPCVGRTRKALAKSLQSRCVSFRSPVTNARAGQRPCRLRQGRSGRVNKTTLL